MKNLFAFCYRYYRCIVDFFEGKSYRLPLAVCIIGVAVLYPVLFHYGFTDIMEYDKYVNLYQLKRELYKKEIALQFVRCDSIIKIETSKNIIRYSCSSNTIDISPKDSIDRTFDSIPIWYDFRLVVLPAKDFNRNVDDLNHPHKLVFTDAFRDLSFYKFWRITKLSLDSKKEPFLMKMFSYFGIFQGQNSKAQLISQKYYNISYCFDNFKDANWWKSIENKRDSVGALSKREQFELLVDYIDLGM
ncbi:MAG: hypothetical protein ACI4BC_04490 [Muribaculaceae bacterium]